MKTTRPDDTTAASNGAARTAHTIADGRGHAANLAAASALMNSSRHSMQLRALAADMQDSPVAQRVIVRGKTHASRAYDKLKSTSWYGGLKDLEQRFAAVLQAEDEIYTIPEAEVEIASRIAKGIVPPEAGSDEKTLRKKRVTEYINGSVPDVGSDAYTKGDMLASAGEHAFKRLARRYRRKKQFRTDSKVVKRVKPGLFRDQQPILSDRNPFEQMFALLQSTPTSFNYDIGGSEVKLDAIDIKSNKERGKKRKRDSINLGQVFVEQTNGENSYWSKADSRKKVKKDPQHEQLRHLEVMRDNKSAVTTYLKENLLEQGTMDNKEAFGDEGEYAFQEYKGALKPSRSMLLKQRASAYHVLTKALESANTKLGTKVGTREMASAKSISDCLDAYDKNKTVENRLLLVKEVFRLIRANTGMDIESDDDSDSESL